MNSEIERAFVAALTPVFSTLQVVPFLTGKIFEGEERGLIVDASADNESPVATLWKMPIAFRFDFPALAEDEEAEEEAIRSEATALFLWLKDTQTVLDAFESQVIKLLPRYHIGAARHRTEGDRLISEIEITAGLQEI